MDKFVVTRWATLLNDEALIDLFVFDSQRYAEQMLVIAEGRGESGRVVQVEIRELTDTESVGSAEAYQDTLVRCRNSARDTFAKEGGG